MQVLAPARRGDRFRGQLGLIRTATLGPTAREQFIYVAYDFGHFLLAKVAREQVGHVLDHTSTLGLVNGLGIGAHENDADLVASVFMVVAELHLAGLIGVATQRLQGILDHLSEIAADVPSPADLEQTTASLEYEAGLVALNAFQLVHTLDVKVVEPRL